MGQTPAVKMHLTDVEKQCVTKLTNLLQKQNIRELDFYWEVGQVVAKVYAEAEKLGKDYDPESRKKLGLTGPQRVLLVAKETRIHPKILLDAVRVVERWETKERFDQLVQASTYQNRVLTFAHIKELSRILDDNVVFSQAKKAAEEGLSARELQLRLKEVGQKGKKRGSGRKPKVPDNLEACIISMKNHLQSVINKVELVWFGKEYNLLGQLSSVDAEFFRENPKFFDQLADIASMLNKLHSLSAQCGTALCNYLEGISDVFTTEEPSDEEEEEESEEEIEGEFEEDQEYSNENYINEEDEE